MAGERGLKWEAWNILENFEGSQGVGAQKTFRVILPEICLSILLHDCNKGGGGHENLQCIGHENIPCIWRRAVKYFVNSAASKSSPNVALYRNCYIYDAIFLFMTMIQCIFLDVSTVLPPATVCHSGWVYKCCQCGCGRIHVPAL